jgi:hypothetical protein
MKRRTTPATRQELVQELQTAIINRSCRLDCQLAGSNVCTCPCQGVYHGVGMLIAFAGGKENS